MPTKSSTTRAEAQALVAVFERVMVLMRRLADTPELSLTAASTLRALERRGPRRLSDLASAQGVTQPAMTQLVSRLERGGYARRGGSDDDARVVLVRITERGRELMRQRRDQRARHLGALVDALAPRDRAALFAAVPALNLLADLDQPDDGSGIP